MRKNLKFYGISMISMICNMPEPLVFPRNYLTILKKQGPMGGQDPKTAFWGPKPPFWGFWAPKTGFRAQTRPWRPLRETLQKHKGLGRFWEAQGRKTPKMERFGQKSPQNK